MRCLVVLALLSSAASASEPPAIPRRHSIDLQFNGAIATRYLWQPSLRREAWEYLYHVGVRANGIKRDGYGLAVQSYFTCFDTKRYTKGFAATGVGNVPAEPVFNFNRLYLDGYVVVRESKLAAQFGVLALDLPTVQLPLTSVQVGGISGWRADIELKPALKLGALIGNLRTNQTQEVFYKIEGVRERYNYARAWVDKRSTLGKTRLGVDINDTRFRGFYSPDSAYFVEQETPLVSARLIPRLYARYQPDADLFSEVVISVEGKPFGQLLLVRPGYIYYSRNARAVHPPNSNFFAPGIDQNNVFLYVESPLPRASDSLYAAVTTSAKRFMARQGTRFETGIFLRFKG